MSLDLLSGFPTSKNGYDCVVAFADHLSKRAFISPCYKTSSSREFGPHLFFKRCLDSKACQGMSRILLSDNGPQFISKFWSELFVLLGTKINLTSTYHPQSNWGQEKFYKTLIEVLRTYVSHRQDNWDECILFFEFAYYNSVNPKTGHSPFILSSTQSPRVPWQFLDSMLPDDVPMVDDSHPTKLSGTQMASSLGLDIINNVCETLDTLHLMSNEFRVRNTHLAKPHSYKVGDTVLLSTENVELNLPCKKFSPTYVGPFTIKSLLGDDTVY
jgi:hypothetical protein